MSGQFHQPKINVRKFDPPPCSTFVSTLSLAFAKAIALTPMLLFGLSFWRIFSVFYLYIGITLSAYNIAHR